MKYFASMHDHIEFSAFVVMKFEFLIVNKFLFYNTMSFLWISFLLIDDSLLNSSPVTVPNFSGKYLEFFAFDL